MRCLKYATKQHCMTRTSNPVIDQVQQRRRLSATMALVFLATALAAPGCGGGESCSVRRTAILVEMDMVRNMTEGELLLYTGTGWDAPSDPTEERRVVLSDLLKSLPDCD